MATKTKKRTSKRPNKSLSLILAVGMLIAFALMITTAFLPLATSQSKTLLGSGETNSHSLFAIIEAKGIENLQQYKESSNGAKQASFFYADADNTTVINTLVIAAAVVAVIGIAGIIITAIIFVKPKLSKLLKPVGIVSALASILTFVIAIVAASTYSGSASIFDIELSSLTVAIGIGSILALAGGLIACVLPLAIKK